MYQPRAKVEFVRRYCAPGQGWRTCVEIDASEEGRTGGPRRTQAALNRRQEMQEDADRCREEFKALRVNVGRRVEWCTEERVPNPAGAPSVIAYRDDAYLMAEVQAQSPGQPGQSLDAAVGRMIRAASCAAVDGWRRDLVIVVCGAELEHHLRQMPALKRLGIAALALRREQSEDEWFWTAL